MVRSDDPSASGHGVLPLSSLPAPGPVSVAAWSADPSPDVVEPATVVVLESLDTFWSLSSPPRRVVTRTRTTTTATMAPIVV